MPSIAHRAARDVVEARDELRQRGLAGARRPDERHQLAGLDDGGHAVQHDAGRVARPTSCGPTASRLATIGVLG